MTYKHSLAYFWDRFPALFYGLIALLSLSFSFERKSTLLFIFLLLCLTSAKDTKKLLVKTALATALFLSVNLYCHTKYQFPEVGNEGVFGTLVFEIKSLSISETPFGKQWIYQGKGVSFLPDQKMEKDPFAKNFPCTISIPYKKGIRRPPSDKTYILKGILKKNQSGSYFVSRSFQEPWIVKKNAFSFVEKRFQYKQAVRKFLKRRIYGYREGDFLAGIATGLFEEREVKEEFGKLGLLHLMAISGFHFAFLTGILAFFFRLLLPWKLSLFLVVFFMSTYFIFLGSCPSVLRAWVMSFTALFGLYIEKKPSALNALGLSCIVVVLYEPLFIKTLGFQFSLTATASILIFYPLIKRLLHSFFRQRVLSSLIKMSLFDQHCYCILSFLKEGLALAIAVNLAAAPMTLYFFQKFPVMSLFYNLFIPFLVSLAMLFVAISASFSFLLPPIGAFLFSATSKFSHFMLNFVYHTPQGLNIYWYAPSLPFSAIALYLTAIFLLGIFFREKLNNEDLSFNFSYL